MEELELSLDFEEDLDKEPELSEFEQEQKEKLLETQTTLDEQWKKDVAKAKKDKAKSKLQTAVNKAVIEAIDDAPWELYKRLKELVLDRKGAEMDLAKNTKELTEALEDYKKKHQKIHDKKKKKDKKGKKFDKVVEQEDIDEFLATVKKLHEEKNNLIDKYNYSNSEAKSLTLEIAGDDLKDKIDILDLKVQGIKTAKKKDKKTPEVLAKEAEEDIVKQVTLDAAKYKAWKAEKAKKEKDANSPKYSKEYLEMMLFGPGEKKYGSAKRAEYQAEYFKYLTQKKTPVDTKKLSREVMKSHVEEQGDKYKEVTGEDAKMLLTYMLKGTVSADDKILIIKFVDKYVTKAKKFNDVFGYDAGKIKPTTYIKIMSHDKVKDDLKKHKDIKPEKGADNLVNSTDESVNIPDPMPSVVLRLKIKEHVDNAKELAGKLKQPFTKDFWKKFADGELPWPEQFQDTRMETFANLTGKNDATLKLLNEMERLHKKMVRNKENAGDKSEKDLLVELPTDRSGLGNLFNDVLIEAGGKKDQLDVLSMLHLQPGHYHAAWKVQKVMSDDSKPLTEKQNAAWGYYTQYFTGNDQNEELSEKYWGKVYTDFNLYVSEVYNTGMVFRNLPPEAKTGNNVEDPNALWKKLGEVYKKAGIEVLKDRMRTDQAKEYLDYYIEEMITNPVLKVLKKPYVWIPGALAAAVPVGKWIYDSYQEGDYTALGAITDFWKLDKTFTWGKTEKVGSGTAGNSYSAGFNNRPKQGWFGTGFYNNATNNPLFNAGRLNIADSQKKEQLETLNLNLNFTAKNYFGRGNSLTTSAYMNNSVILGNQGNAGVNTMAPTAGNTGSHSFLSQAAGVATNPSILDFSSFMPGSTDDISLTNILNYDASDLHNAWQPERSIYSLRAGVAQTLNIGWWNLTAAGDIESHDNFGPTGTDLQAYRLRFGTGVNFSNKYFKKKNRSITANINYNNTWTNDLPDGQADESEILTLTAKIIMGDLTVSANVRDDLLRNGQYTTWDAGASYVIPAGPLQKYGKFTAYFGYQRIAKGTFVPAVGFWNAKLSFTMGNR